AETHLLGALRHRGQEDLRGARVAVLLEEVVLDLPAVLDAELVGELALLQRVLQQRVLGVLVPRTRELVLVEQAELHGDPQSVLAATNAPSSVGRMLPCSWNSSNSESRRGLPSRACSTSRSVSARFCSRRG